MTCQKRARPQSSRKCSHWTFAAGFACSDVSAIMVPAESSKGSLMHFFFFVRQTFLFLMAEMIKVVNWIVNYNVSLGSVFSSILFTLPFLLTFVLLI